MKKQDVLFTSEQMRGSGQSDMVALINQNEDRKALLRITPHNFFSDPGHGWLQVCHEDLKILGILGAISECSYRMEGAVYLEEDMDATTYISALFTPYAERTVEDHSAFKMWRDQIKGFNSNSDSFIRNLNHL